MANEYTTLAKVRDYLGMNTGAASSNTQDDALLLNFANRASRAIDRHCRRKFYPRSETRFYDDAEAQRIQVDDDLLGVTSLVTQNGACALSSGLYWPKTGDNWNRPPYDSIEIDTSSGSTLYYSGTPQRSNRVVGIWGYHESYPDDAWIDTGTSLLANYSASGGTIALAGAGSVGAGASDVNGEHPRISPGDILKIGDEFFSVLGGGTSGNGSVIVKPYQNGTTATAHASGASIAKWAAEPDIEWSTRRLVGWMFGQKDTPYQNKTAFVQLGTLEIPVGLANDIKSKIDRFVRRTFQVSPKKR